MLRYLRGNHPIRSGTARAMTLQALHASRRARRELLVVVPLLAAVLVANAPRREWFGKDLELEVRIIAALVILALGWRLARDFGRSMSPWLFRRMAPATAGTVGF